MDLSTVPTTAVVAAPTEVAVTALALARVLTVALTVVLVAVRVERAAAQTEEASRDPSMW
jgi:hypothetical protein